MKKGLNVIDLFSGIGGFSLGLRSAGFELEKHYYSEVNKHAIANYKYNFKDAKYIGAVTDVRVGTCRTYNGGKEFRRMKNDIAPTLLARGRRDGSGMPVIQQRPRGNNKGGLFSECPTISANSFQENNFLGNIRQLTEIECERLQGFPDDWTRWGDYSGKEREISRTERYKMIGNSVTVDVVAAVAKRLRFEY